MSMSGKVQIAEVRLPELSEGSKEAVLSLWYYKVSEYVQEGESMAEVVTDKATFDLPAPCSGVLCKIAKKAGETVMVNDLVAEIQITPGSIG